LRILTEYIKFYLKEKLI